MRIRMQSLLILLLLLSLLLPGCSGQPLIEAVGSDAETPVPIPLEPFPGDQAPGSPPGKVGTPPGQGTPQEGKSDFQPIVNGNTEFAFNMMGRMDLSLGNLVFSPISISTAFALAFAGAEKNTASQMKDVLRYPLPRERFHAVFGALLEELKSGSGGDEFTLTLANSLWGQAGLPFRADYLELLAENYAAEMGLLDFADAESARRVINDWVASQTEDRIQEVLQPGSLSSVTRLVLVNAIYFKALWEHPFNPDKTSRAEFDLLDGSEVDVDMMLLDEPVTLLYGKGEDWQAVSLSYKDGLADMLILMPDEEEFASFFSTFTMDAYQTILDNLGEKEMLLSLPKFSFETGFTLSDDLSSMGMPDAFDPARADFSGMDGTTDLYIEDAYHLAFINVDEIGTEAGAATGILMRSGLPSVFHLVIDRPFFYFIRDGSTGTILFMGYVIDPR